MSALYQSDLWIQLRKEVYHEETFELTLWGTTYTGTKKTKKIWPLSFSRLQVMGIMLPEDTSLIEPELQRLRSTYASRKNLHIQLGFVNELARYRNHKKAEKEAPESIRQRRQELKQTMRQYGLLPSFRRNMPEATYVIDIAQSDEDLYSDMSSGCRESVRKAEKRNLRFEVADPSQYEAFYEHRQKIAGYKGFNIVSYETFCRLADFLKQHNAGDIFLVYHEDTVAAWSVFLYIGDTILYLYGFMNRDKKIAKLRGHQYLKAQVFSYARDHKNMKRADMMGWAPTGDPDNDLTPISQFKQSLWGETRDFYGNFDCVINPILYKLFQLKRGG